MINSKTLTDLFPLRLHLLPKLRKATATSSATSSTKDDNDLYLEAIEAEIDTLSNNLTDLAENLAELFSDPKTGQDSARRVLAFIGLCPDLNDRYRALFREEAEARLASRVFEEDSRIEPNLHIRLDGGIVRY